MYHSRFIHLSVERGPNGFHILDIKTRAAVLPQAEVCVDLSSLVNMPKSLIAKLLDAWMSHRCPTTVSFH